MVGDSKAEGEEKWGGADAEGGSWYKRIFQRVWKRKSFWNSGWGYSTKGRLKVWGGSLSSLRALHPERERSKRREKKEGNVLRREEEVFNKKDWEGRERRTVTWSRADLVEWERSQVWLLQTPCSSSLSYVFLFLLLYLWIIWLGVDVRRYGIVYVNFWIAYELIFC